MHLGPDLDRSPPIDYHWCRVLSMVCSMVFSKVGQWYGLVEVTFSPLAKFLLTAQFID